MASRTRAPSPALTAHVYGALIMYGAQVTLFDLATSMRLQKKTIHDVERVLMDLVEAGLVTRYNNNPDVTVTFAPAALNITRAVVVPRVEHEGSGARFANLIATLERQGHALTEARSTVEALKNHLQITNRALVDRETRLESVAIDNAKLRHRNAKLQRVVDFLVQDGEPSDTIHRARPFPPPSDEGVTPIPELPNASLHGTTGVCGVNEPAKPWGVQGVTMASPVFIKGVEPDDSEFDAADPDE